MPVPTATLAGNTRKAAATAQALAAEQNDNFIYGGDANLNRKPAYYVYIYQVGDREIRIPRAWAHPEVVIVACKEGEEYSKPVIIADIVAERDERANSWEVRTKGVRGEFLAQDALNPDDMNGNWEKTRVMNAANMINEGTNQYNYGCWWSIDYPPTPEQIAKANERLDATANAMIDQASLWALGGPNDIQKITPLHRRMAARMTKRFGRTFSWNQTFTERKTCPGCGESVSSVLVAHLKDCYVWDWQKALDSGLRTMDQAIAAGVMKADSKKGAKKEE